MCKKGCSMLTYHNLNDNFLKTLNNIAQKLLQCIRLGKKNSYTQFGRVMHPWK